MKKSMQALAVAALTLASCGGSPAGKPTKATTRPSPSPEPVFCPLTGVETFRGFNVNTMVLAVKIENSTAARPQAGLNQADIVYEELTEGGITRFMALYHCTSSSSLGPVRSARLVDHDILQEYKPVAFAYSGANPVVLNKLRGADGIVDLRHGANGAAYSREKGRKAPSNLFTTIEKLRAIESVVPTPNAPEPPFVFDVNAAVTATATRASSPSATGAPPPPPPPSPGLSISFSYSGVANTVNFAFDIASRTYVRSHGSTVHKTISGDPVRTTNVVVLKVRVSQSATRDAAGNFSSEINTIGGGEAFVLRGGVGVTGRWQRPTIKDRTVLVDSAGKPIALLPGNTWIHLVPDTQPVTIK